MSDRPHVFTRTHATAGVKAGDQRPQPVCAYSSMLGLMSSTTRITVTLPSDQVAELRKITDNVSGYVAEAVARQIRHQLLGDDLRRHEEEHGPFTDEELTEARGKIFGSAGSSTGADAA